MNSSRLNSKKFKFSSPQPPIWVTEAFANMGPKYSYIAEYFNQMRNQFKQDIVAEIEKSLPGTQNEANVRRIKTAHQQKVFFMMRAIDYADRFRPIKNEIGGSVEKVIGPSITRPRASDTSKMQIVLKNQIASTAKNLASLLRQHNICSDQLGIDWIECDPLSLSLTADNNQPNTENALLRNEYDLVLSKMNLVHRPELFVASVLDRLEKLSSTPSNSLFSVKSHLGLGSRKTTFHFIDSFTMWIAENCEDGGGCMPDNFHLTNKCWAVLSTCLLGHEFDEPEIAIFLNRKNKYNNITNGEKFSIEMFDALVARGMAQDAFSEIIHPETLPVRRVQLHNDCCTCSCSELFAD